ncbi:glucose-6-phosphate dehydrogenase [Pokkaliibacter plantistimulans]|uniref:Glucose-6-phosphate 1-dehydrogenase n=2 Tax=Pokkaliibacter plantistimulans TaxID=1635171 RepID=A0ABX5M3H5_9GAMM|nr:glucose-6-phosphate dehydrogenase [Pokkaliibacter plantistimulans]PXF32939.1 glucose-6-phosphate dehydrogenase [Pokkaliibacter plantistimulans]
MTVNSQHACNLALFGAMGDLSRRKLLKALYYLDRASLLHADTRIIGLARNSLDDQGFKEVAIENLQRFVPTSELDDTILQRFVARLSYIALDMTEITGYQLLADHIAADSKPMVAYMATPPSVFGDICANLDKVGLSHLPNRIVLEKPLGKDLSSSQEINDKVAEHFKEQQIYRIDHYLGKETVQNLIALRFANNLFGSQWNQNHIDHVQITVAEEVGVEGRWSYYDKSGQMRDMIQNHLLQLLCLIAMDPPYDLSADSIRDEKLKVLRALKPMTGERLSQNSVRGQYVAGTQHGKAVPGYLEEEGANLQSTTETFVALKAEIGNWRWAGVPFYLRTGKRMPSKVSEIIIQFRQQPHYIFAPDQRNIASNKLIIRLQPDEGMTLQIATKDQGLDKGMRLRSGPLELNFSEAFKQDRIPDAYERLLLEVMLGNQSLFVRRDEVEYAWRWVDQIIQGWENSNEPPKKYQAGTWGPVSSIALISRDGRSWNEDA